MKTIFSLLVAASLLTITSSCTAQDKSKRPSPPATVTQTLPSSAVITINYSQPSVKGRTIGKDLEPMPGKVWRTGANEATTFETSKAIKVNGHPLPAGKYALFTLSGEKEWTVIFNKTFDQWGAFNYKESEDALRVQAMAKADAPFSEQLRFTIDKNGMVNLLWGSHKVEFKLE